MNYAKFVNFSAYSGRLSENIVKWKKALIRNFDFLEWDQRRCAQYIPTLLSEKALRYYESLPETTTRNYKSVLDALHKKFSQKIRGALQANIFLDRRQLPNENVESYAREMNEIYDKYEVTNENVKMSCFIRGLKNKIKRDLLKQKPSNFDECEEYAQIIEAADLEAVSLADAVNDHDQLSLPGNMPHTKPPRTHFRQWNANSKPFCQRCNTRHTFGQHTRRLPPRQTQQGPSGQNVNMRPLGSNPAHHPPTPYQARQPSFSRPPFHPANPTNYRGGVPVTPRSNPTYGSVGLARCFHCGLTGHKQNTCERVHIHISSSSMLKTELVAGYGSLRTIAMVDSGSQVNIITERKLAQLSRLSRHKIQRRRASFDSLTGIGDRGLPIQGYCTLHLRLKDKNRPLRFYIVPEICNAYDFIILGRDFLDRTNAILDLPNNALLINWHEAVNWHDNDRNVHIATNYTIMPQRYVSPIPRRFPNHQIVTFPNPFHPMIFHPILRR